MNMHMMHNHMSDNCLHYIKDKSTEEQALTSGAGRDDFDLKA